MVRNRSKGSEYSQTLPERIRTTTRQRWVVRNGSWQLEESTSRTPVAPAVWASSVETISDHVGERDFYNPVIHSKPMVVTNVSLAGASRSSPTKAVGQGWSGNTWYTVKDSISDVVAPLSGRAFGNLNISGLWGQGSSIPWATLVGDVAAQLDGRMVTSNLLLVDFVQLTQTVSMVKNPFNVKALARLKNNPLTLRQLMKSSANGWLEYQYGWRNLERSIGALAECYDRVRQHKEYLKQSVNRYVPLSSSWSERKNLTPSVVGTAISYNGYVYLLKKALVTTARFSLNVRRTGLDRAWSNFDLVCQDLGLSDLAASAWDLIPFSFVLDWFVQANDFLVNRPEYLNLTHDLRRIGCSIETDCIGTISARPSVQTYDGTTNIVSDSEVLLQHNYSRSQGFPSGCDALGVFGSLNKHEMANGLALIVQRM